MYRKDDETKKKPAYGWHPPEEAIEGMYLTILSRYPMRQEVDRILAYSSESGLNRWEASVDTIWALMNTKEFIFKH